ncbi:PBCV-specific basic adaptor domain-containing protein [Acanthocystis turfacea Chlorella virus MO0605SPH]|nr:PBCV-specific basic adaptor domain-containing protein [Acanthocystis turfacea Chlorella virus MO0605SPH]
MDTGKVNSKGRKVLVSPRGATYVMQDGKKLYVKKLITPVKPIVPPEKTDTKPVADVNSGRVNSKGRKVFVMPRGGKYVLKDGKKIPVLQTFTPKKIVTEAPKPTKPVKEDRTLKVSCSTSGLFQISSTCWFNSALNGVVLASKTGNMLIEKLRELPEAERAAIWRLKIDETCQRELTNKYVLAYAYRILGKLKQKTDKNVSLDLVGKVFTPGKLPEDVAKGGVGFTPITAVKQILSRVFPDKQSTYYTGVPGPYFMVYKDIEFVVMTSDDVSSPASWPVSFKSTYHRTFDLSHCSYIVELKKDGALHAVVAYVCNGKKFVFDSRLRKAPLEINWSDKGSNEKILNYSVAREFARFSGRSAYALYVKR